jgi:hypothetical protein
MGMLGKVGWFDVRWDEGMFDARLDIRPEV